MKGELISLREASEITGIRVNRIRKLIRDGDIPHCRIGSWQLAVRVSDIENYFSDRMTRSYSPYRKKNI